MQKKSYLHYVLLAAGVLALIASSLSGGPADGVPAAAPGA